MKILAEYNGQRGYIIRIDYCYTINTPVAYMVIDSNVLEIPLTQVKIIDNKYKVKEN